MPEGRRPTQSLGHGNDATRHEPMLDPARAAVQDEEHARAPGTGKQHPAGNHPAPRPDERQGEQPRERLEATGGPQERDELRVPRAGPSLLIAGPSVSAPAVPPATQ